MNFYSICLVIEVLSAMRLISARNSQWMKAVLFVSGVYSILWGASVVFFPKFWFNLGNIETPNYLQLWQFFGVYSISMGVGYLIAHGNPLRHWAIVLIGLIGKVLTPIGFFFYFLQGDLPPSVLKMNITNDIIWWIPFALILYNAYIHEYLLDEEIIRFSGENIQDLLSSRQTDKGEILLEMTEEQPVMFVFLRYFGCAFCRETLQELYKNKESIEKQGVRIVLIHQLEEDEAQHFFDKYHLKDIDSVSDPELMLYKGFQLQRGRFSQIFGLKSLVNLFLKGKIIKLGISTFKNEDPFQMPGVFVVQNGEIVKKFIHNSISDTIPFKELADCSCKKSALDPGIN